MKILSATSYQVRKSESNQSFSGFNAKKASLFTLAALSLVGCATQREVLKLTPTLVQEADKLTLTARGLKPADDPIVKTIACIKNLAAQGKIYMETRYQFDKKAFQFIKKPYALMLDTTNPITIGYNYNNVEKLFGLPSGSLVKSNGLYLKKTDPRRGKELGKYGPDDFDNFVGGDQKGRIALPTSKMAEEVRTELEKGKIPLLVVK